MSSSAHKSRYRPKHTLKKRTGPLPLRPKQYAKALYYEFINQFEKVTIKHAHDRRVAKQLKIKRDLERRGGSSGHHHLVFGCYPLGFLVCSHQPLSSVHDWLAIIIKKTAHRHFFMSLTS